VGFPQTTPGARLLRVARPFGDRFGLENPAKISAHHWTPGRDCRFPRLTFHAPFKRASVFRTISHAGIFSVSARLKTVARVGFFFPRSKKLMYVR
jgi:hypothetical protein